MYFYPFYSSITGGSMYIYIYIIYIFSRNATNDKNKTIKNYNFIIVSGAAHFQNGNIDTYRNIVWFLKLLDLSISWILRWLQISLMNSHLSFIVMGYISDLLPLQYLLQIFFLCNKDVSHGFRLWFDCLSLKCWVEK